MKYNLAINSQVESNTQVGNVQLSTAQILPIIQTTSASSVTLSGTDVLCLDCDLGARVKIDEIRYYFSSSSVSGTVADSINFYHKNEDFDVYLSLETLVGSSYYYTTIISGTSAPRYLRMVHTVSGTSISGTTNGFQVMSDDDVVDFGTDGSNLLEGFDVDLEAVTEEIRPVYIYNDGDITADAYVLLEPQKIAIDEILSISVNPDGPWYNTTQEDNVISGENIWDTGNYVDTAKVFEQLELATGSGIDVGTYTTRIFDTIDTQKFTYLNLNTTYTGTGMIVATNGDATQETMEIRSSNTEPLDYIIYRKFIINEGIIPIKYREYCIYEDTILFDSPSLAETAAQSPYHWNEDSRARLYINKITRKMAGLIRYCESTNSNRITLLRLSKEGVVEKRLKLIGSGLAGYVGEPDVFSLFMDNYEGIWFYVYYPNYANESYFFDQTYKYYLAYFDKNMSEKFKLVDSSAFVYDMSCVVHTGDLWYTDQENNQAIKIDNEGNILATYAFVDQVKGIIATTLGDCWVIQGKKIFNINSDGILVGEIDLTDVATDLSRIAWDGDDAFWITDGFYVRRVLLNGQIHFSIELPYQSTELQPYDTGVAVFCIDRSWRFISKDHKRIIKTIENSDGKNMYVGVVGATYDNLNYANEFPIPFDDYWVDLEWSTVLADYYLLPEDKYNQIRLTLRANDSSESPIVNSLYLNESIQVPNIYSKNYKTMYLKADITGQDESDIGAYESNLKVWWYIPV
jgi:hypothetical protein